MYIYVYFPFGPSFWPEGYLFCNFRPYVAVSRLRDSLVQLGGDYCDLIHLCLS